MNKDRCVYLNASTVGACGQVQCQEGISWSPTLRPSSVDVPRPRACLFDRSRLSAESHCRSTVSSGEVWSDTVGSAGMPTTPDVVRLSPYARCRVALVDDRAARRRSSGRCPGVAQTAGRPGRCQVVTSRGEVARVDDHVAVGIYQPCSVDCRFMSGPLSMCGRWQSRMRRDLIRNNQGHAGIAGDGDAEPSIRFSLVDHAVVSSR